AAVAYRSLPQAAAGARPGAGDQVSLRGVPKADSRSGAAVFLPQDQRSGQRLLDRQIERCRDTGAIGGVGQVAVPDVPQLDMPRRIAHRPRRVAEQALLLIGLHQAEQIPRLGEVIRIVRTVIVTGSGPFERQRRLAEIRLFLPLTIGVRLIVQAAAVVTVNPHGTVTVESVHRTAWRVHRDLMVVDAQTVALRVTVGEQTALQHAVRREAGAPAHVGGWGAGLGDVRGGVGGVAMEVVVTPFDQRVVPRRADLGQVEPVEARARRLGFRHRLRLHGAAWELTTP